MHNKRESWLDFAQKGVVWWFWTGEAARRVVILDREAARRGRLSLCEDDGLVAEDLRGIRSTRRGAIDLRAGRAR